MHYVMENAFKSANGVRGFVKINDIFTVAFAASVGDFDACPNIYKQRNILIAGANIISDITVISTKRSAYFVVKK